MTAVIPRTPYIYEIEPTNACPYKCIMCPRGLGKMKRPLGYMEPAVFMRAVSSFPEDQKLVRLHHFGEAALHPNIDEMMARTVDQGMVPVLSVNPATLSATLNRRLVGDGDRIICFSIDSLTDERLLLIRGIRRGFAEQIRVIEDLIEKSRAATGFTLKIFQMVRLQANEGEREAFFRLKKRFPGPDIYLYFTENTGFGDIDLIEKTTPGGSGYVLPAAFPCDAPFSECTVLWNGDVVLCCFDYNGDNRIGNLKEKTIAEIWEDEPVNRLRRLFKERRTDRLPLCGRCYLSPHRFDPVLPLVGKGRLEEQTVLDMLTTAKQNNRAAGYARYS